MSEIGPRLSIIIAAPPDQEVLRSIESLKCLNASPNFAEVIVVRGCMPSIQRNVAAKHASGEWLYFLDDDSMLSQQTWSGVIEWIGKGDVDVVGGPNLCPQDASFVQSLFVVLLGSMLTFGPSRARYVSLGEVRRSSEKELILCNLMVRKSAFEKAGGFDEALYPNEENALMESIGQSGGKIFYDPKLSVDRYPRSTMSAFFRMLFRYGCGRAQQFRRHPSTGSLLNMAPAIFLIYSLVVVGLFVFAVVPTVSTSGMILLSPFMLYGMALVGQMLLNIKTFRMTRSVLAMPMMFFCHVFYGAGFWAGCLMFVGHDRSTFDASEVFIEKVSITNPSVDSPTL